MSKHSFDVGYRFYYWKFYQLLAEDYQLTQRSTNQNDHGGHNMNEMYIPSKYVGLKQEILNNRIYSLKIHQLTMSITKTKQYVQTRKAKKTVTPLRTDSIFHYGIQDGSALRFDHILSITLYTDWSELSTAFSSTFRKQNEYDTLLMIKKRNMEYHNFSKYIREIVEYYGNFGWRDYEDDKVNNEYNIERGPFFCGMSFIMVIPQFNILLNGPTSTSKQIEVAYRFSGDEGIVIQINNNMDILTVTV